MVLVSCRPEDDDDPPIPVEDGFYIKGEVAPFTELNIDGMMASGINEVGQIPRTGMFEKFITLRAGEAGFNIVQVAGAVRTTWGPFTGEDINTEGLREQPNITIRKGTLGQTGVFTVPTDGLYHIIIDITTNTYVIAPVPFWAIIGQATPIGWTDTQMPLVGDFAMNTLTYQVADIVLRAGEFKFRYGGGWKLEIHGDTVKVNTNFGGVLSGNLPNLSATLVQGGPNYAITAEQEGLYTVTITWTLADGFASTLVRTGDAPPPAHPAQLFMIGDGVGTWDWTITDLPMIPVHSKPHLFWKIVWLNETGGFKFSPVKAWEGTDFGKAGDPVDGIFAKGTENVPVPGIAGYYMVVVNLETAQIAIADPKVYLIGNVVGSWDTANPDALFSVDNAAELVTITKMLNAVSAGDGGLRMYAWFDAAAWFTDWWQSEFIVLNNVIEFRGTGGDQQRVEIGAGMYRIDLNFRTGAGAITPQ